MKRMTPFWKFVDKLRALLGFEGNKIQIGNDLEVDGDLILNSGLAVTDTYTLTSIISATHPSSDFIEGVNGTLNFKLYGNIVSVEGTITNATGGTIGGGTTISATNIPEILRPSVTKYNWALVAYSLSPEGQLKIQSGFISSAVLVINETYFIN